MDGEFFSRGRPKRVHLGYPRIRLAMTHTLAAPS
jgi:hypothetical protein